LRRRLRARRSALTPAQRCAAANQALHHLRRSSAWRSAGAVALYHAYGSEMPTDAVIELAQRCGKRCYLPRLHAGRMQFVLTTARTRLMRNRHGIAEPWPARPRAPLRHLQLVLVPLTGFDRQGTRLGTGGGYYDRRLAAHLLRPRRIGWAYALQEVAQLPREAWDLPLHAVCTERGWLGCTPSLSIRNT
jgi:5-formyltetrahydrofolate cyclo-ligase